MTEKKKVVGKPFQKGKSGNPGGRPKIPQHVKELAQAKTEDAVLTLIEIMGDGKQPAAARVSAANSLLDRGYGKPAQQIEAKVEEVKSFVVEAPAVQTIDEWVQEYSPKSKLN